MAEPRQADGKPTLVAVGAEKRSGSPPEGRSAPAAGRSEGRRGTPGAWLLALGLAIAVVAALVQTQRLQQASGRVATLEDRVLGLEADLAAANAQIDTLEMQRGQVREAVQDLSQRVMRLSELLAE